jgi:hypothetical protein
VLTGWYLMSSCCERTRRGGRQFHAAALLMRWRQRLRRGWRRLPHGIHVAIHCLHQL